MSVLGDPNETNWFKRKPPDILHEAKRLVLNTIQSEQPDNLGTIFVDHVASVNDVERHWKDTEVNMHRMNAK